MRPVMNRLKGRRANNGVVRLNNSGNYSARALYRDELCLFEELVLLFFAITKQGSIRVFVVDVRLIRVSESQSVTVCNQ